VPINDEQLIGMGPRPHQNRQQIICFVARGHNDGDLLSVGTVFWDLGRARRTAIPLGQIDNHAISSFKLQNFSAECTLRANFGKTHTGIRLQHDAQKRR
jgi:hypothetical protein